MRSTFLPSDAARLLAGLPARWWVAGGWAIDLWLGRQTRDHEDLDIAILRSEQSIVRAHLVGWDLRLAHDGTLQPLTAARVDPHFHAVWCRRRSADPWAFELLMNETVGREWLFRRDPSVRRPLARLGGVDHEGIPFMCPEIVLLFKAKHRREVDEADFATAVPRLHTEQRRWLGEAIQAVHPGHEWVGRLRET